jgi:hypothetical protein
MRSLLCLSSLNSRDVQRSVGFQLMHKLSQGT